MMEGSRVVSGAYKACQLCAYLVWRGLPFGVEPLSGDRWEFTVQAPDTNVFDQADRHQECQRTDDERATYWEHRFNKIEFNWPHVEWLAATFHVAYELAAAKVGWKTQESCRVAWNDLPDANRRTMLLAVKDVLGQLWARFAMLGLPPGEYQLEEKE